MGDCITTYTGKHFDPTHPDEELICIEDIAHALSLLCRGNGHVRTFFSVGQHCILCAKEAEARGYSGRLILASLLHDASECYMSDVPRPFKKFVIPVLSAATGTKIPFIAIPVKSNPNSGYNKTGFIPSKVSGSPANAFLRPKTI